MGFDDIMRPDPMVKLPELRRGASVVAVIQARMGSERLPGKVLRELPGGTVLEHVIRRVRLAVGMGRVVVATTTLSRDDRVASVARDAGALVTRGAESDVLARFVQAFDEHGGEVGVRVTGDCPLLDPQMVVIAIRRFLEAVPPVDYLSNTLERTYPRGYDIEIFSVASLRLAAAATTDPAHREHVTPYLYRNPARFRLASVTRPDPEGTASWRLTLDTLEDWRLIQHLFGALWSRNPAFGLREVEEYLRANPGLLQINQHVKQASE